MKPVGTKEWKTTRNVNCIGEKIKIILDYINLEHLERKLWLNEQKPWKIWGFYHMYNLYLYN